MNKGLSNEIVKIKKLMFKKRKVTINIEENLLFGFSFKADDDEVQKLLNDVPLKDFCFNISDCDIYIEKILRKASNG